MPVVGRHPLTHWVTAWVSVPILLLIMAFGALLLSDRTMSDLVIGISDCLGLRLRGSRTPVSTTKRRGNPSGDTTPNAIGAERTTARRIGVP